MALSPRLVYCLAVVALTVALPATSPEIDSYQPQPTRNDDFAPFALPTNLQLPKAEGSQVPFFAPDLSTLLRAPAYDPEPNYYSVPIPSQDLVAPPVQVWNPDNDPKFFYEIPASLTQQNLPTNSYPKKFNKDLHIKSKPYSTKPKQEVVLRPIEEKQYAAKQKTLSKVFDNLAKKENRKEVQVPSFAAESKVGFAVEDAGEFHEGFGAASAPTHLASSHSPHGERHEFHMAGHDGPHSYKWGFDTGKGHNRQFRYEERDKEGIVKGHFGFYDKHGKLQMVEYDAHPHDGYHADGNFGRH